MLTSQGPNQPPTWNAPGATPVNADWNASSGLAQILNKPTIGTAAGYAASAFEPAITTGTSTQYWRGDKCWQTLNASTIGLGNVTNDAQVKVSTVTALGDLLYGTGNAAATNLPGNISTTRKFLRQAGTGTASTPPAWDTVTATDVNAIPMPANPANGNVLEWNGSAWAPAALGSLSSVQWGNISGTLANQSDLNSALAGKAGQTTANMTIIVSADGNDNNSGIATAIAGTVSVTNSGGGAPPYNITVTGTGTTFTTSAPAGSYISINGETRKVSTVLSDTQLIVNSAYTVSASGQTAYVATSAKQTIQGSINAVKAYGIINHTMNIYVCPGTYGETVTISGLVGGGSLNLYGAKSATTSHAIQSLSITNCSIAGNITIYGMQLTANSGVIINASYNTSVVYLNYLYFNPGSLNAGTVFCQGVNGTLVRLANSSISYANAVVYCAEARVTTQALSGSNNNVVLESVNGGFIQKWDNNVPSGTTPILYSGGGLIIGSTGTFIGSN